MGLFDAISGIAQSAASAAGDFISDFGGGAFVAIDERLRGGRASPGSAAGIGRVAGSLVGNIFGDIAEGILRSPETEGARGGPQGQRRPRTLPRQRPTRRGRIGGGEPLTPEQLEAILTHADPFTEAGVPKPSVVTRPPSPPAAASVNPLPFLPILSGDPSRFLSGGGAGPLGQLACKFFPGLPGCGGEAMPSSGGTVAMPGGSPLLSFFGLGGGGLPDPALASGGRIYNFRQNMLTGSVSATPTQFWAQNPVTGRMQSWSPDGRIILTSRDLTAARRVQKIARRASRGRR